MHKRMMCSLWVILAHWKTVSQVKQPYLMLLVRCVLFLWCLLQKGCALSRSYLYMFVLCSDFPQETWGSEYVKVPWCNWKATQVLAGKYVGLKDLEGACNLYYLQCLKQKLNSKHPDVAAFRCAQRAGNQALRWAASSRAVPTSTTTGVLWSQVSAALCPLSPLTGSKVQSLDLCHVYERGCNVPSCLTLKEQFVQKKNQKLVYETFLELETVSQHLPFNIWGSWGLALSVNTAHLTCNPKSPEFPHWFEKILFPPCFNLEFFTVSAKLKVWARTSSEVDSCS